MKSSYLLLLLPIYILIACMMKEPKAKEITEPIIKPGNGFAVIELFTSQGCSSCPSADEVLSSWVKKAEKEQIQVYPLAFHVDYWNRLGWKDPFSQSSYSERQSSYVSKMKLNSAYTPQVIVNGKVECVGSNAELIGKHVMHNLSLSPENHIVLAIPSTTNGVIDKIGYHIDGDLNNLRMNIAIVEQKLVTIIRKGENSGKTLTNDNVVREFTQIAPQINGEIPIKLAPELIKDNTSIIVYLQDVNTLEIKAAKSSKL